MDSSQTAKGELDRPPRAYLTKAGGPAVNGSEPTTPTSNSASFSTPPPLAPVPSPAKSPRYEPIRVPDVQKRYKGSSRSRIFTCSDAEAETEATQSLPARPNELHSRGTSIDTLSIEKEQASDVERNSPWPSVDDLRQRQLQAKQQRMRQGFLGRYWAGLSQAQRQKVRFGVFVLVLMVAIGLGLGISFAVKGRIVSGTHGLTEPLHGSK